MTPAKPDSLIDDLQALSDDLVDGNEPNRNTRRPAAPVANDTSMDTLIDELVAQHLPTIERELRTRLAQLGEAELHAMRKRSK